MTKAQAVALLEHNITSEFFITEDEYRSALHKALEDKDVSLTMEELSYRCESVSFVYDKHKYYSFSVVKQHWDGDWDIDSVVFAKTPYISIEEMVEMLGKPTTTSEPDDFPMDRKELSSFTLDPE